MSKVISSVKAAFPRMMHAYMRLWIHPCPGLGTAGPGVKSPPSHEAYWATLGQSVLLPWPNLLWESKGRDWLTALLLFSCCFKYINLRAWLFRVKLSCNLFVNLSLPIIPLLRGMAGGGWGVEPLQCCILILLTAHMTDNDGCPPTPWK